MIRLANLAAEWKDLVLLVAGKNATRHSRHEGRLHR